GAAPMGHGRRPAGRLTTPVSGEKWTACVPQVYFRHLGTSPLDPVCYTQEHYGKHFPKSTPQEARTASEDVRGLVASHQQCGELPQLPPPPGQCHLWGARPHGPQRRPPLRVALPAVSLHHHG